MGPEDHVWIKHLQIDTPQKESGLHSGDGYYYDLTMLPTAKGGKTIPFGLGEFSLSRLLEEARKLDIHVYDTNRLLYFETAYTDAIIEIVGHANFVMTEWWDKRNFMSSLFNPMA